MTTNSNCVTCCPDKDGKPLVLLVMTDGESFYSYVFRLTDLETGDRETVYEAPVWLTSMWVAPGGAIFAVDADGGVHSNETGAFVTTDTRSRPGLTRVWGFDDERVFACGRGGVAVRKAGPRWVHFDEGLDGDLYGIHGAGDKELYIVGEEGRIFHHDGAVWTRIDPPTNYILNAAYCQGPDLTYVCGEKGTIFRGSRGNWRLLDTPKKTFYSLAEFRKRIYLAAGGAGVFVIEGDEVTEFKTGITSYNLVGSPDFLFSAGADFIDYFDGTEWWGNQFE